MARTTGNQGTEGAAAAATACCGCAAAAGRKAVGVDAAIKESNLKHLRRIEGQVRGILRMVEEDRYCADIVTQVAAVRESLQSVSKNLLRNHLAHCAASAMRRGGKDAEEMLDELVELVGRVSK